MGPLTGIKVVELGGIGPVPFAGMMLADHGADVVRIDRVGNTPDPVPTLRRGKRSLGLDLKQPRGVEIALTLVQDAAILIEGFRPGVAERLELGPEACHVVNPRLIYGRMTGWGQSGPLAETAGHDLNFIALSGVLGLLGRPEEPPSIPLNLIGDFGGGGMLLAFGVLAAFIKAQEQGSGEVVDAAMIDGSALLLTMVHGLRSQGLWPGGRGENYLDGGAPFYNVYQTADGQYATVAALEPAFYDALLSCLGMDDVDRSHQFDREHWLELRARFAEVFNTRTLAEWEEHFAGSDACFAPVLVPWEASGHPHAQARETYTEIGGVTQPAPAPRFSRSPLAQPQAPPAAGADTDTLLAELGYREDEIMELRREAVVG